ncbi:putative cytochrome P450 phenylacetate 2-hydroxylase [Glonium stellatum]|uniref:Putative cytochrome P450 phenylacetate 2-hydroxylase n=1 Tax=Glonium stellatum TaxID=574774 RepID=A0A8E2JW10_9PEZI|nr:putative cytochrome P450 phenylacetate 2-hydroxylase [Glonium stellatum]
MSIEFILGLLTIGIYLVIRYLNSVDTPKIQGLPQVPGVPVFGNLFQLGSYHHVTAQKLAKKYGPVFQVRMGNRRVVFVNTFESVKDIWIGQQTAMMSRPILHTFHKIISSDGKAIFNSESFTVGTSPWDTSCKNRKKAIATAMNRPKVQSYMPFIDLEVMESLKEILRDSNDGDINVKPYIQRIALNMSLSTNFGYRIGGTIGDHLLKEITTVEAAMAFYRSTSSNWQDYVPLLRLFSKRTSEAGIWKVRRQKYMSDLHDLLKQKIVEGTDKPCISGGILKDPDSKGLNETEIKSIGFSIVAGGLDTLPGNLIMAIAYFSSEHGSEIQRRAYEEIMKVYPDGNAWEMCVEDGEKVAYITALTKEILRFWSSVPVGLPRVNISPVYWKGVKIPSGTTFLLNTYAANYDPEHFEHPEKFMPERYLGDSAAANAGIPHYTYGAGLRMCAGYQLANREFYVFLVRLIVSFEVIPPKDPKDRPILNAVECSAVPTSLTLVPKPFKVGFKPRDRSQMERWISKSEAITSHLL